MYICTPNALDYIDAITWRTKLETFHSILLNLILSNTRQNATISGTFQFLMFGLSLCFQW